MKYFIRTLGCAMNYSDSERVAAELQKLGCRRARSAADADLYIFNTCSIRQKGEDRVYGKLADLEMQKKRNNRLMVGLTGCMVRRTSTKNTPRAAQDKLVRDLGPVDFVFRIEDTKKLGKILRDTARKQGADIPGFLRRNGGSKPKNEAKSLPGQAFADNKSHEKANELSGNAPVNRLDYLDIAPNYTSQFQAFVPVQIGCDKYCTYCIVPYARGREQSRPMKEILTECKSLVENGCKEITLVGQTVNSYGRSALDIKSGAFAVTPAGRGAKSGAKTREPFVKLLTEIDKLHAKGLNRLRFTSPHPYDYTDALIKAHINLKTLTPHFHIPVQAGSDETLKRMNRRYTVEQYKQLIKKIHKTISNASITTDIIVGFCGETRRDFAETLKLFKEIKWDMAYLARYSPRPGTVSARTWADDVPRAEKARRWHALNEALTKCSRTYNKKLVGRTLEVLVEKYNTAAKECEGRSRENKTVQFKGSLKLLGTVQKVKVTKALEWNVKGELKYKHANPRLAAKRN